MNNPIRIILLAGLATTLCHAAPPDGPGARPARDRDGAPHMRHFGPEGARGGERGGERAGDRAERFQQARDQFDLDQDGTLNDAEKAAARETLEARRADRVATLLNEFDANGDGLLNAAELAQLLESQHRKGGPEAQRGGRGGPDRQMDRGRMMQRFDADQDGALSDAERDAARGQIKGRMGELRGRLLEQFDTNGDGELDQAEREAAHAARRAEMEARRAELMQEFDTNGDGTLDEAERTAARESMRDRHPVDRPIRRADTNRDGHIDAAELAAAAELINQGDARADFNRDGVVDAADLKFLAEHLGDQL